MANIMTFREIVISNSADWDTWIPIIRIRTKALYIWNLIDPNLPPKIFDLIRSITPLYPLSKPGKPIDANAFSTHRIQPSNHKVLQSEYDNHTFGDIVMFIQDTISALIIICIEKTLHTYIFDDELANRPTEKWFAIRSFPSRELC